MDSVATLRFWAAAAWADGELHPSEAAALRRLIDASDLSAEERREAEALLTTAPQVQVSQLAELPPEAREGIYRAALGIVRLDKVVKDEERQFLAKLRGALDLSEETIAEIEAEYKSR